MSPANDKTICLVLERYCEWLQQQTAKVRSVVAAEVNLHLDEMRGEGKFGDDGRQDPRGA